MEICAPVNGQSDREAIQRFSSKVANYAKLEDNVVFRMVCSF
jgi:hypothetical protein